MNDSKQPLVIFGAGGFARLASVYFAQDSPYEVAAFTVHQKYLRETELLGRQVIPFENIETAFPPDHFAMFVAIGYEKMNKARAKVYGECKARGYTLASYISSHSTYWQELQVGENSFIFENNAIHPFVTIGNNTIIGSGNHIGHDTVIGDHCFLAGHAMIPGFVRIGDYSFIGANATIKDGITIAPECVIGAGAVILHDTQPGQVFIAEETQASHLPSKVIGAVMHSPFFKNRQDDEAGFDKLNQQSS